MQDKKIVLSKLIEALYSGTDSASVYYCISQNTFVVIDHEARRWVEDQLDPEVAPEWMRGQIALAKTVIGGMNRDYYPLPDRVDIDELEIMTRFAHRVHDVESSRAVLDALKGRGAFRNFRQAITDHGLLDHWNGFRDQCYVEIAVDWCQRYGLKYTEG